MHSPEAYVETGKWFQERSQFDCAADDFRKAVKLQPRSAKLEYLLGMSLFASGKLEEAIGALRQSVLIAPEVLEPHLVLGAALDQKHYPREAEVEWRAALGLDPHSSAARDRLTRDLIAEKDFAAVIGLLTASAIPLTDEQSVDLAQAYVQTGRLDDAFQILNKAYRADPSLLPIANALAGVLVMQSRKQEAEDILQNSMRRHPVDTAVKTLYLRLLVMDDETEKGGQLGKELLLAAPQSWEVQYLNGILDQRNGLYVPARAHFEQAVTLNPECVECRQNLGTVLARLHDAAAARVQLESAIALGSQDPEVRFELAGVLRELGENQDSLKQLKLYQNEAQAKSDLTQAGAKAAFGDEKLAAGEPVEAAKLFREALSYAPQEASLAYKLAMALDKCGDLTGERAALEQAIAIDPRFAEAHNQLGYLDSRAGQTAAAEARFRRAVSVSPGYVKAWVNLAAMLLLESKWDEASEAVTHALQLEPGNEQAQKLSSRISELGSRLP